MRIVSFFVSAVVCLVVSTAAFAQEPPRVLPIPIPPNAVVQAELDARDDDLLGMVKSLLAGIVSQKTTPAAAEEATRILPAAPSGPEPAFMRLLSEGQISALLKDIHHLHIVTFSLTPPQADGTASPSLDLLRFYEETFLAEGGRRIAWSDVAPARFLMVGFDKPKGFAAVLHAPGRGVVVRADGYPNMEVLGGLMKVFVSQGGMRRAGRPMLNPPTAPSRPTPPAARKARPTTPARPKPAKP